MDSILLLLALFQQYMLYKSTNLNHKEIQDAIINSTIQKQQSQSRLFINVRRRLEARYQGKKMETQEIV